MFKAILCFCISLGTFTSVANPMAWRSLTTYQVMSSCHHSKPCLAEYSKAWWLLCQPSPNASNATHLNNFKINKNLKFSLNTNYSAEISASSSSSKKKCVWVYQLFLDRSPVFHACFPQTWQAELTSQVIWYTHITLTPCNGLSFFQYHNPQIYFIFRYMVCKYKCVFFIKKKCVKA